MDTYTEIADVIQINGNFFTLLRYSNGRVTADPIVETTFLRDVFEDAVNRGSDRFRGLVLRANSEVDGEPIYDPNHAFELKYDASGLKAEVRMSGFVAEYDWDKDDDTIVVRREDAVDIQWRAWLLWIKHVQHIFDAIAEYR